MRLETIELVIDRLGVFHIKSFLHVDLLSIEYIIIVYYIYCSIVAIKLGIVNTEK